MQNAILVVKQPDDLYLTSLVRSESFNMIADPPTSSMAVLTPASNQPPIQVQGSTIPSIVLPLYSSNKIQQSWCCVR